MNQAQSGKLQLTVVEAKLTRDTEMFGKMDPYCIIELRQDQKKTTVKNNAGKTPKWNETFDFNINYTGDDMWVKVFDKDLTGSDAVGSVQIKVSTLTAGLDEWYTITYKGKSAGQIRLMSKWTPSGGQAQPQQQPQQQVYQQPPQYQMPQQNYQPPMMAPVQQPMQYQQPQQQPMMMQQMGMVGSTLVQDAQRFGGIPFEFRHEVNQAFQNYDKNRNGQLDHMEAYCMLIDLMHGLMASGKLPQGFHLADDEQAIQSIFNSIDTDRSGSLSAPELEKFFNKTLFKGFQFPQQQNHYQQQIPGQMQNPYYHQPQAMQYGQAAPQQMQGGYPQHQPGMQMQQMGQPSMQGGYPQQQMAPQQQYQQQMQPPQQQYQQYPPNQYYKQ